MTTEYHIISRGKEWAIKKRDAKRAMKLFPDKPAAIDYAKESMRGCRKIWVHNTDGTINGEETILIPWFIAYENKERYVYQAFFFQWEMQKHTFCGADFIGMNTTEEITDLSAVDRIVAAGKDGFMPELVKTLKDLIGDGNYIYDGYGFTADFFELFFLVKEKIYKDKLQLIDKWRKYNTFDKLMAWEEKHLNECVCQ